MKKMTRFAVAALVLCVAFGCGKEEKPAPSTSTTPSEAVVEPVDGAVGGNIGQTPEQIQKQDPKPKPKPNIQKQDDVDVIVIQGEEP